MALDPFFVPGTNQLTESAKKILRDIFQAQELAKFIKKQDLLYPNPEDPDNPWGPIGPWVRRSIYSRGSAYPNPEDPDIPWGPIGPVVLERALLAELTIHALKTVKPSKDGFSLLEAIKREKVVTTALKDLSSDLKNVSEAIKGGVKLSA